MILSFFVEKVTLKQLISFGCENIFYIRKNVCEVEKKRKLLKSNHNKI